MEFLNGLFKNMAPWEYEKDKSNTEIDLDNSSLFDDFNQFLGSDSFKNITSLGSAGAELFDAFNGYGVNKINRDNLNWQKDAWNRQFNAQKAAMEAEQAKWDRVNYGSVEAANRARAGDERTNYFNW